MPNLIHDSVVNTAEWFSYITCLNSWPKPGLSYNFGYGKTFSYPIRLVKMEALTPRLMHYCPFKLLFSTGRKHVCYDADADPNLNMKDSISLYIVTFNCAKSLIDVDAFSTRLFSELSSPQLPDLLVFSLQEIAPISCSLIGGSFIRPYLRRFHDLVRNVAYETSRIHESPYNHLVTHHLGSTGLMIFAKDVSAITNVDTAGVGVGLWGMGNKGAAGVRLRYQNTLLTFVAVHLAAMEWKQQRRNEDWENIVRRLVFTSQSGDLMNEGTSILSIRSTDHSIYKASSHLFVAGDLNYRTSLLPPTTKEYMNVFPQPYFSLSDEHHFLNLLKSDQLNQARRAGQTCHGLIEPEINFPPTYKYKIKPRESVAADDPCKEWRWAAHRWPSWCDRILYLDVPTWLSTKDPAARIQTLKYNALPLLSTSDHRPVVLEIKVPLLEIPEPGKDEESDDPRIHPPFEVDANWKNHYLKARRLELSVGWMLWFTTTWEGGSLVLAGFMGTMAILWFLRMDTYMIPIRFKRSSHLYNI